MACCAALILTALPFTFDGVTPAVSKAHAIIGRPLTPLSVAGVHRRAVRRTFGVGANLGYSGYYHRNFGPYAYNRLGYGYHPVARAAVYGAALRRRLGRRLGRLGLESPTLCLCRRSPRLGRWLGRLGLESPVAQWPLCLRRRGPRLGWRVGLGRRLGTLGLESWMEVVIESSCLRSE